MIRKPKHITCYYMIYDIIVDHGKDSFSFTILAQEFCYSLTRLTNLNHLSPWDSQNGQLRFVIHV